MTSESLKSRAPHLLAGSTLGNWARLLVRNGGPSRRHLGKSAKITACVLLTTPLRGWESIRYRGRLARVELDPAPVFIIGHWQAGHSPVHYLLSRDPRFGAVTLLHCAMPAGFLTLKRPLARFLRRRLPQDRLVDSLPAGLQAPQGDDMALAGLSDLSFYHAYSFPRQAERTFRRAVLLEDLSERAVRRWLGSYVHFLRKVAFDTGRPRLLLRNASNTGRIPLLLRRFPQARFIHVYRNPYQIYAALAQRWQGLLSAWALQEYTLERMEEHTLQFFELLMRRYFQDRREIPKGQLVEVRHEDFEADPLGAAEALYRELNLPEFEEARGPMQNYLATRTGSLGGGEVRLSDDEIARVTQRWGFAIDQWGYAPLTSALS